MRALTLRRMYEICHKKCQKKGQLLGDEAKECIREVTYTVLLPRGCGERGGQNRSEKDERSGFDGRKGSDSLAVILSRRSRERR
jgi:hypothetical protein